MGPIRAAVGLRNLLFVLGTIALYPIGQVMVLAQPHDPQGAMGVGGGLLALWFLAALIYVVINIVLLIRDLRKGRPAHKSAVGIALPFVAGIMVVAIIG